MTRGEGARTAEDSVGALFLLRVRQQVAEVHEQDARVREEADESIHKMRVAVRRLRSALATYRPVLEEGETDELRVELRWLGCELSPARDAEVLGERLEELLEAQPAELVMGPVRDRVRTEMTGRHRSGLLRALEVLDSDRYARLLASLDGLATAPPLTGHAGRPAREELPGLLRRDLRRVRRRATAVKAASDPRHRDLALHETRKAAKRLRYAAESAVPAFGSRAEKLATRAKRVQDVLGEHQDTVVARITLRELGAKAYLEQENGFTFGRLHALEESRAEKLVAESAEALSRLPSGSRLVRWKR